MLRHFFTATAKKGYVALVDQGMVSGTNFLTGVLLARLCTKEQYGLYVLAFSLLLFWDGFRNSLVGSPLVVYLPRKPAPEQPSYIGSTTVMHALLFLAGAVAFGAAAGIIKATGDASLAVVVLAAIFALCGYSSREHVRRVFYAHLQVRATLLVDGAYCVLQLSALGVLWKMQMLSAMNALLALGASQTASALFGLLLLSKRISFRELNLRSALSSHWKLGKWLVATSFVFALAYQLYPWLLKYFSTLEAAAVFGACMMPVRAMNPLLIGFTSILMPWMSHVFAKEGQRGLRRVVMKGELILGGGIALFAIVIAVFSKVALDLMYAGKYSDHSDILRVLCIYIALSGFIVPLMSAFVVTEKPHMGFYTNGLGAVCTLSFGILLIYAYGTLGAVVGVASASGCRLFVSVLLYRRLTARSES